jgi:hypothetical protein
MDYSYTYLLRSREMHHPQHNQSYQNKNLLLQLQQARHAELAWKKSLKLQTWKQMFLLQQHHHMEVVVQQEWLQ